MKLWKCMVILLLVLGFAVGCAAEPVETLAPTETVTEPTVIITDPPTEEPTQPVTEPPADRLPEVQAVFDNEGFYHMAAGHIYVRTGDADLNLLFYNGVNHPGSWNEITESDRELLMGAGFWTEMDIQIMPASLLEEKLNRFFGLGLADVRIPDGWVYSADTDTYYSNHNDAYYPGVTVVGCENLPDGNVLVSLTVDMVEDGEEWYWDAPMYMTLSPCAEGWQIVSNVLAE